MALNVLRTLSEEIFVYKDEDIDERRYSDLIESLNFTMSFIMPTLRRFMTEKLVLRERAINESEEGGAMNIYENLLIAALEVLAALSEWVDYK
jgi:predicted transcriptional regulator